VQADGFQIPAAYKSFTIMQRYLPIAARSQGEISSQINFKGRFDEKLHMIPASLNGKGLSIHKISGSLTLLFLISSKG
jgi:hypothetical protein